VGDGDPDRDEHRRGGSHGGDGGSLAFGAGVGTVVAGPSPGPQTVMPVPRLPFTWTFSVTAQGALGFSANGLREHLHGDGLRARVRNDDRLPPGLAAGRGGRHARTVGVGPGDDGHVTVTNTGGTAALNVTPTLRPSSGLAAATGGPAPPAAASLAPGASVTFTWTFTTSGVGTVTLTGSASGADANSGTLVRAPAAAARWSSRRRRFLTFVSLTPSSSAVPKAEWWP